MEISSLINRLSSNINANVSNNEYFSTLASILNKEPYYISLTWNDSLCQLNFNPKKSDFSYPEVRQSYGVIFERNNNIPIVYSYDSIVEFNEFRREKIETNWDEYQVESIIDGAVIRLYNYNGNWYKSTLRSINADSIKWNAYRKSFSQLFDEAAMEANFDYSKLDRDICYTFIICHKENQMIINYETPTIHLISATRYNKSSNKFDYLDVSTLGIVNPVPTLTKFKSFSELEETMRCGNDLPLTPQSNLGYIFINKNTNERIMYRHPQYIEARNLKGNTPDENYRILEIIVQHENQKHKSTQSSSEADSIISKFTTYFPSQKEKLTKMYNRIDFLADIIHKIFVKIYIKKQYHERKSKLTSTDKFILESINMYYKDRYHITKDFVKNHIMTISNNPRNLAVMLHMRYVPKLNNKKQPYKSLSSNFLYNKKQNNNNKQFNSNTRGESSGTLNSQMVELQNNIAEFLQSHQII